MIKPVTGQYECVHQSGIGLDYFTARVDRLTLYPNGRFTLIVQESSRAINAAKSLLNGQQVGTTAPEKRREGHYLLQPPNITLHFDDMTQEQGKLSWNGEGVQIGQNFFTKVSDSTMLPPTNRLKKDMDDIAKGLKVASTIGGIALKVAKGIQETIQTTQSTGTTPDQSAPPIQQQAPPAKPEQPVSRPSIGPTSPPAQPEPPVQPHSPGYNEALFCDQCGARSRPGKRFCGNCGAQLF